MDMKLMREKLFDEFVDHDIEYVGSDGKNYKGHCVDWLEDGSLVIDATPAHTEGRLLKIINGDFIQALFADGTSRDFESDEKKIQSFRGFSERPR
jgi:hypothetical protein